MIMRETDIFRVVDQSSSTDELLDQVSEFYREHGFGAVCYVLQGHFNEQEYLLFERGMPEGWMQEYVECEYNLVDPIPDHVSKTGEVDTINGILEKVTLTQAQAEYIEKFNDSGVTDGLAMPTYGKNHARGFFGIAQVSDEDLEKADRSLMHAVAQHTHWRYDHIATGLKDKLKPLSSREQEVLSWIAAGKSNSEIATILGISMPTVATHLKRLFAKLKVNDRVSAALNFGASDRIGAIVRRIVSCRAVIA